MAKSTGRSRRRSPSSDPANYDRSRSREECRSSSNDGRNRHSFVREGRTHRDSFQSHERVPYEDYGRKRYRHDNSGMSTTILCDLNDFASLIKYDELNMV